MRIPYKTVGVPQWGSGAKLFGLHSFLLLFQIYCRIVSPIKWENLSKCIGIQNEKSLKFDDYYSVGRPKIRY